MSTGDASSSRPAKRPRKQALVACNRCQRSKIKCDNARPTCGSCQRANVPCEYDTENPEESRLHAIRRQYGDLQVLQEMVRSSLDWLRSQPPSTALSCLERLRDVEDPMRALCSIVADERTQHRPQEIPVYQMFRSTSPLIKNTLSAELVSRYPTTFPLLPYAESTTTESSTSQAKKKHKANASHSNVLGHGIGTSSRSSEIESRNSETMTYDELLKDLRIGFWTIVPISDGLAAKLVSSYLQVEHPVYGFFDPNLFLRDLIAHKVQYCSPLLVNSLLFWTSCTFGPIHAGASSLANPFLDMAQRLWEGERSNNDVLNVASLMILSLGTICFGKDKLAKKYVSAGIRMAEELYLVGEQRRAADEFTGVSQETLNMLTYVAWGSFNFSCVYLLHFHDVQSPSYTSYPPLLPVPDPKVTSSGRVSPPEDVSNVPSSSDNSFQSFCKFWCIAHEIASVFYSSPGPIRQHVPLAFAEHKFQSLLGWAQSLPSEVRRSDSMSHNVAEMHICYHATIMDLFRPFLAQGELLSTFATSPQRPETIFSLAFGHLRALIRYYHLTFTGSAASHSISWVHGPLYVAPAILHYDRSEGWESEFLSCIKACADLLKSHQVLEGFLRALLGMAVVAGAFSMSEAVEHLDDLRALREDHEHSEVPEVGFVVDQDLAMESRAPAIGDILAQQFDEMLFQGDPFDLGL